MTTSNGDINHNRRAFLAGIPAAAATVALGATQAGAQASPLVATGRRRLGNLEVSELGLGVQNMHRTFHTTVPDRDEMIRLIRSAYEQGVTFFDCAEVYGPFECERILGEAMAPFRNDIQVTTKFGFGVDPDTGVWDFTVTSEPRRIRRAVEGSLRRLGTDRIDLLYQHRVDPNVPIEEVAGVVRDLMDEGKVLHWGLSEMGPGTLRRAHEILPVSAVQSEYSMLWRGREADILPLCAELGIGFVPFAPLGYGFLTGAIDMETSFAPGDFRAMTTRMDTENRAANMALVDLALDWAAKKGVKPGQIALAWLLAQGDGIVPIPGTTQMSHLRDNVAAAQVRFTPAELAEIRTALDTIKVQGGRAPQLVADWSDVEAPDA
ncbi:aldo/keto reductase [uncultured Roseobacter sp.]|uniref:aldo/keto reductase n=1 Tax=uncultured Roseobacter sp. TaxID=114847 RepID=UPI002602C4EC|nr:aldo/keto reductase [uncultured Roseobacter sp.]